MCSAADLGALRESFDPGFVRATPEIRLASDPGDQRRVVATGDAVLAAAHYLVLG